MWRYLLILTFSVNTALAETIVVESGRHPTALVELYTSEGCHSCPPADAWLAKLIQVPKQELNTLALAFHVDYWDYIGWNDPYANPDYTLRQRLLARMNRQNTIYTPEFFVDGREARGTRNILKQINEKNAQIAPVALKLAIDPQRDVLDLKLEVDGQLDGNLRQQFFIYENGLSSDIDAGENDGKTLHHERVVRLMSKPMPVSPTSEVSLPLDSDWRREQLGVVARVYDPVHQQTLQLVYSDLVQ